MRLEIKSPVGPRAFNTFYRRYNMKIITSKIHKGKERRNRQKERRSRYRIMPVFRHEGGGFYHFSGLDVNRVDRARRVKWASR